MFEQRYIAFFTVTVFEWKRLLTPDKYKQIVLNSLKFLVDNGRVSIYGFVIMPNHLHLLWKIEEFHSREKVQRDFLKFTTQQIKFDLTKHHPQVLERFKVEAKDRKYQIWERNALSFYCHSQEVTEQKLAYIHANPVSKRWNLAESPEEYLYSSAAFYLKNEDTFGFLKHYLD